jgi:glycosyltransferase involved in cell wall biosynthesis
VARLRVGLDATPLLGTRTGIGHATAALLAALAADGRHQLVATAFTLRGRGQLEGAVPRGVEVAARPAPARGLQELWARSEWPPVELLSGRVDVFHATNFVLPPLRRARGVVTVHDLAFLHHADTVSATSARLRELVPRSLRRAAAVVTPSEAVADQVREAYAPRVPVVAVPHGVDDAWRTAEPLALPLRRALGLPPAYLLFVGTLEPRKDVATLVAAHRLLPDAPPLVLVGPPGWGAQVDTTGCVTPGYLEPDVLRSVVASASALVLPSRDEGFGLPLLEALAAGTPVVASDLPVLREVGGDVVTYAPAGDPDGLAAAIAGVLADPGAPGHRRERATGFTWARAAEATRAVYELALS